MESSDINTDCLRKRNIENVIIVWLDDLVDQNVEVQRKSIEMLRRIVNDIYMFTEPDACVDFITNLVNEYAFLIIGSGLDERIIPLIHDITQLDSVYIICGNSALNKKWTADFRKVRSIFTNMTCLSDRLQADQRLAERKLIQFHIMSSTPPTALEKNENKNKQNAAFMLAQLVQETILKTTDDSKQEMIAYCSAQFFGNLFELQLIQQYEREYISAKAIWWYTRNSFLYKMVNKALRVQDVDILYKMRTFIRDLHSQLSEFYHVQHSDREKIRCLYRGQCMSKSEFNKIKANVGGLLSITNFFSTSASRQVALVFAGESNEELIAVVFEIHLNSSINASSPFACIENVSHFGDVEHEWLFSMGSVFRIEQIELYKQNTHIVHVTPSNEQDEELNRLSQFIQPKLQIPNSMAVLGLLLIQMGKNEMAAVFYETALRFDMEPIMHSSLLVNLGECYTNLKQFDKALVCLRRSLEIKLQFVPSNHRSLTVTYNNLGSVFMALGQTELSFKYFEHALEIDSANQNPDYNRISTRLLNLGTAYFKTGEKQKAGDYYQRAARIMLEHLPPNHPNLAVVYNSLSTLSYTEKKFEESLNTARQSLNIRLASVSEDHPSLAESYMNIALTLLHIDGKAEEALENCEKAIQITSNALGKNHPTTQRYQQILDEFFINTTDDEQESD